MGRLGLERVLECFSLSLCTSSCFCTNYSMEDQHVVSEEDLERKTLLLNDQMDQLNKLFQGKNTLAFHLEPKTVILKVSMHCYGCAKKVEKHVSKIEGVTSFQVDLENKKVVVIGDITPYEVLQSVSKVKFAELWEPLPPPPKICSEKRFNDSTQVS